MWMKPLAIVGAVLGLVVAAYAWSAWQDWRVLRRFRARWSSEGRDLLLIYSESPHWQEYVEQNWLPRWRSRAVVLNWSERSRWLETPEVALFRRYAGRRAFNPLAILVPPRGRPRLVRFWLAFRDRKHGKELALRRAEEELAALLREYPPPGG